MLLGLRPSVNLSYDYEIVFHDSQQNYHSKCFYLFFLLWSCRLSNKYVFHVHVIALALSGNAIVI